MGATLSAMTDWKIPIYATEYSKQENCTPGQDPGPHCHLPMSVDLNCSSEFCSLSELHDRKFSFSFLLDMAESMAAVEGSSAQGFAPVNK